MTTTLLKAIDQPDVFITIFKLPPDQPPQKVTELPKDGMVWVHIRTKQNTFMQPIANHYNLHPLAIEDCFSRLQLPKVEEYDHHTFVVLHGISIQTETNYEKKQELHLPTETKVHGFIGERFLMTHSLVESAADKVITDLVRGRFSTAVTPDVLFYRIVDHLVDEAIPLLDLWETHTSNLEERLMGGVNQQTLDAVFEFRRHLRRISKIEALQREVLYALSHDHLPGIREDTRVYMRDAHDHVVRLVEYTLTHREALADALEINLALIANRTNRITLRLSVLAVILFPPTIVSGIFGMNFETMPWIKEHWGFWLSMVLMFAITLGLFAYISWNKWLKGN